MNPQSIIIINSKLSIAEEIIDLSNDNLQVLVYDEDDTFENVYFILEEEFLDIHLNNSYIKNICFLNENDYLLKNDENMIDFIRKIVINLSVKHIDFQCCKLFYDKYKPQLDDLKTCLKSECAINFF